MLELKRPLYPVPVLEKKYDREEEPETGEVPVVEDPENPVPVPVGPLEEVEFEDGNGYGTDEADVE